MIIKSFAKIIATLALFFVIAISNNQLNPDWLAYKIIYEEGGAWLAETGRDPLYMIINNAHKYILNISYEEYRKLLSAYFIFFTYLLVNARLFKSNEKNLDVILLILAVTSLVIIRFTVQIREGIGLTLALLGYLKLFEISDKSMNWSKIFWAAVLLTLASLFHSSFTPSLLIVLFVYLIDKKFDDKLKNSFINLFLIVVFFIFIYDLNFNLLIGNFILEKGGGREILGDASIAEQLLKVSFLCFLGLVTRFTLSHQKDKFKERKYLHLVLLVISGPIQLFITISIIYLILNGYSKLVIGDFFRQLSLFINISLFLSVISGCRSKILNIMTLILILENIRGLIVAVSITAVQ